MPKKFSSAPSRRHWNTISKFTLAWGNGLLAAEHSPATIEKTKDLRACLESSRGVMPLPLGVKSRAMILAGHRTDLADTQWGCAGTTHSGSESWWPAAHDLIYGRNE